MKYETLIFDLDGTLSDPFVGISRSINYALESLAFKAVDPESIKPMIGPPLTEIFAHIVQDLSDETLHLLIDKYRERYASIGFRENTIYAEMPPIVSYLDAQGYRLGVCTAKRADYAEKIVQHFSLSRHFDFIDGGGTGVHKSEQIARIIASGVDPASAVMIGDRAGDITAAQSNGVDSIGVLWGFGEEREIELAAPDFIARSPQDLENFFH